MIEVITNKAYLNVQLSCFVILAFLFVNRSNANVDSLQQIWTDESQVDSLRFKAINDYYKVIRFTLPDSVLSLSDYHIELAKEKNANDELGSALNKRGVAFSIIGDYDSAKRELEKAADAFILLNDSTTLVGIFNNLAIIHSHRIEYQAALEYYIKSQAFYRRTENEEDLARILVNIGLLHADISNYDVALDNLNKARVLYENLEEEGGIGIVWLNIGVVNFRKENYTVAIQNVERALKSLVLPKGRFDKANCFSLKAKVYQKLNEVDSALIYIVKARDIHEEIGAAIHFLEDQLVLANLLVPTDLNRAIDIAEESLKVVNNYNDHSLKIELFKLLYKCYKIKGNYALSVTMLEKSNAYADSLRVEQDKVAVTSLLIQEEYNAEILNTQLANSKAEAFLRTSQVRRNYMFLFFASCLLLCIVLYHNNKRMILSKQKEALHNEVSHLRKIETTRNQLIQSDKMASLGQLTAGVAYEINNPINFISSGVLGLKKTLDEYIKTVDKGPKIGLVSDMKDMIEAIEEGAKRTSSIVKSLRHFLREDTKNYIEVDVITSLESTLLLITNKMKEGVVLEKQYSKKSIMINCFPGQLNQAFMNVLLNAIEAVDRFGLIKVVVREEGKNVVISIQDDGPGIHDDIKEKVFEAFYTTKDKQESAGLGLSISLGIVEKHNGTIEIKDNDPKGTNVVINLPKQDDKLMSQLE